MKRDDKDRVDVATAKSGTGDCPLSQSGTGDSPLSQNGAYAAAGVDIEAGYEGVRRMRSHVERTATPGVLAGIGGFGGLFRPDFAGMDDPVLVSGTDGVGTKQRIAQLLGIHGTVGIDCVAMCVNDIVCSGARPLFFLDYIAIGKNDPAVVEQLVAGVAEGCVQASAALVGGETAEHPGTMAPGDYDLAGFAVGAVDRPSILDGSALAPGDILIALASSGLHSNGFSLVRKVFDVEHADLGVHVPELGRSLGEELLEPTRIYVRPALAAIATGGVHAIGHITGGGLYENVPRMLRPGLVARICRASLRVPPIFALIAERGGIGERDMLSTFNMGVGMVLAVAPEKADAVLDALAAEKCRAYPIGVVEESGVEAAGVVVE